MYLIFDTSILIDIERENKQTLAKVAELRTRYPIPPKIAFISYYEFIHGIRKRNPQNKAKAEDFIRLFELVRVFLLAETIFLQSPPLYSLSRKV